MAEIFYGPWNVRLDHVDPYFRQRFSISGSDAADGRYEVSSGQAVNLQVTGVSWSIIFEIQPFPPQAERRGIRGLCGARPDSSRRMD